MTNIMKLIQAENPKPSPDDPQAIIEAFRHAYKANYFRDAPPVTYKGKDIFLVNFRMVGAHEFTAEQIKAATVRISSYHSDCFNDYATPDDEASS